MPRLFLATAPDDADRAALIALRDALRASLPAMPSLRWTADADLHLTLRFFGTATDTQRRDIERLAARTAPHHPAMLTTLQRIEHWPPPAPRVIVVAFADEPALAALAAELETGARALGFPAETRRFRPHVTLARAPGKPLPQVPLDVPPRRLHVNNITLFGPARYRTACKYDTLGRWPLGP
jgi:2'-5' RNA ligase